MFLSAMAGWLPYLAAASLYPLASYILLRRPLRRFIHPLARDTDGRPTPRVLAGAHRGGAQEMPENSLASFSHARHLGMDLLELDVRATRDGRAVVFHDAVVDRVTDGEATGAVSSFDYADLPPMAKRIPLPPGFHSPGSALEWTAEPGVPEDEYVRPPLLSEVLRRYPECSVNIDCKDNDERLLEQTAQAIEQERREASVIWGSANDEMSQKLYKRNPNIPIFFSAKGVCLLWAKWLTGLLPFMHLKESALEIPLFTPRMLHHFRENRVKMTSSFWFDPFVSLYNGFVTSPNLLRHLRARNVRVVFWVLNCEEDFDAAFRAGADGVMTDKPSLLAEYLAQGRHLAARQGGPMGREAWMWRPSELDELLLQPQAGSKAHAQNGTANGRGDKKHE